MRARRLAFAIATVLLVQLLPAGAGSKGLAAEFHSANMTHIKNIPQQNIEGTQQGGGAATSNSSPSTSPTCRRP